MVQDRKAEKRVYKKTERMRGRRKMDGIAKHRACRSSCASPRLALEPAAISGACNCASRGRRAMIGQRCASERRHPPAWPWRQRLWAGSLVFWEHRASTASLLKQGVDDYASCLQPAAIAYTPHAHSFADATDSFVDDDCSSAIDSTAFGFLPLRRACPMRLWASRHDDDSATA